MEEIVGQAIDPAAAVGSTATFIIYHLCPLQIIQDFPYFSQDFCCPQLLVWWDYSELPPFISE